MILKDMIRLVTPPVFIRLAKRLRCNRPIGSYGLSGDYRSWNEALAVSTGYDSQIILEKTKTALLKVKNGEAAYERDSVLFDKVQYAWSLLAGLMWVAAEAKGNLNVLDFGGSLGSTYFQNRVFLCSLPYVKWNIVEQPKYVEVGKEYFEDKYLKFYLCVEDCLAQTQPNVIILSSVLQYLEHPYDKLRELLELRCDYIIIDRTPFWDGLIDRLCVQKVPSTIYSASYPSWIFSRQKFHAFLRNEWKIMAEVENTDKIGCSVDFAYRGMIITRLDQLSTFEQKV